MIDTPHRQINAGSHCLHERTIFYRRLFRLGGGYHVVQLCQSCGRNVRGAGVWVPRADVPGDPDALPLAPERTTPATKQASLFDRLGDAEDQHG